MNYAVLSDGAGGVRVVDQPIPAHPSGTDVLVRMLYAPINPADLLILDGRYGFDLRLDLPLGAEGVGVVEAVSDAVAVVKPGDRVLPLDRGNWCSRRLVPESRLIVLPAGIDPVQAAMLRINPPTAYLLLRAAGVGPGDIIAQNGASSAVARWIRTFAERNGVTVLDVVRQPHPDLPRALIDGIDLAQQVKVLSGGRSISAALDCVAGPATGRMAECLTTGGRLLVFGHLSGEPIVVPSQLLTSRDLSIRGFSLRPAEAALGADGVRAMFAEIGAWHAGDPPSLPVRGIVPLTRVFDALTLARSAGRGRVLLDLAA